jgi:hypothetical protein
MPMRHAWGKRPSKRCVSRWQATKQPQNSGEAVRTFRGFFFRGFLFYLGGREFFDGSSGQHRLGGARGTRLVPRGTRERLLLCWHTRGRPRNDVCHTRVSMQEWSRVEKNIWRGILR